MNITYVGGVERLDTSIVTKKQGGVVRMRNKSKIPNLRELDLLKGFLFVRNNPFLPLVGAKRHASEDELGYLQT